jgi:hypothetical protein
LRDGLQHAKTEVAKSKLQLTTHLKTISGARTINTISREFDAAKLHTTNGFSSAANSIYAGSAATNDLLRRLQRNTSGVCTESPELSAKELAEEAVSQTMSSDKLTEEEFVALMAAAFNGPEDSEDEFNDLLEKLIEALQELGRLENSDDSSSCSRRSLAANAYEKRKRAAKENEEKGRR